MLPWPSLLLGMLQGYLEWGKSPTRSKHGTDAQLCLAGGTWKIDLSQAYASHSPSLQGGGVSLLASVMLRPAAPASHLWQQQNTAGTAV